MGSTVRNMVLVIVGGRARSIDGNVAGHRSFQGLHFTSVNKSLKEIFQQLS